jgi:hypothetical protein
MASRPLTADRFCMNEKTLIKKEAYTEPQFGEALCRDGILTIHMATPCNYTTRSGVEPRHVHVIPEDELRYPKDKLLSILLLPGTHEDERYFVDVARMPIKKGSVYSMFFDNSLAQWSMSTISIVINLTNRPFGDLPVPENAFSLLQRLTTSRPVVLIVHSVADAEIATKMLYDGGTHRVCVYVRATPDDRCAIL